MINIDGKVIKEKGLSRDFLKPYGIDVPTDAKKMVTLYAVALLSQFSFWQFIFAWLNGKNN